MLLFVSQAERVRARGSHRRVLRFRGLAFALQSHANPGIRRAEVRAFARIASTEYTPPACMQRCARGAGQGDTGRRRAISPSTRPFTPRPRPRPHNPSGRSGLMVEDWARITSGALLPPSSPAPSLFTPPPLLARWSCLGHWS